MKITVTNNLGHVVQIGRKVILQPGENQDIEQADWDEVKEIPKVQQRVFRGDYQVEETSVPSLVIAPEPTLREELEEEPKPKEESKSSKKKKKRQDKEIDLKD